MATTAIWAVKDNLKRVINYAANPSKTKRMNSDEYGNLHKVIEYTMNDIKTEMQYFVSGINITPEQGYEQMNITKESFCKNGGILAFHGYQSFSPGEVTPEVAHEIGIKLAERMWGDRFEVIVTTHLDHAHLHNHFVLNSVSFVDGKRYYDNKNNYRKMRELSDQLCKEHSLHVIENPKNKSLHYAEWLANKEKRPTKRSLLKNDIDEAINRSMTYTQFIHTLKMMGYEVKTNVKHHAIRPPGDDKKFIRFKSIAKDDSYDVPHIKQRILDNKAIRLVELKPSKPKKVIYKGDIKKARKLTGFRALYFHYLYYLGILPNQKKTRRVHPILKNDLLYLDKISKQVRILSKYRIDNISDLERRKSEVVQELNSLRVKRQGFYNQIRRCNNNETKETLKQNAKGCTLSMKKLREEVKLYDGIKERSLLIKEKVSYIRNERKERDVNERRGRNR